jgi:hypothetical protein
MFRMVNVPTPSPGDVLIVANGVPVEVPELPSLPVVAT